MPTSILTGTNYNLWAHNIKTVLLLNQVWDTVETEFKQLEATAIVSLTVDQLKAYKDL